MDLDDTTLFDEESHQKYQGRSRSTSIVPSTSSYLFLDIGSPALANLCRSLDLVTSWNSSATILHHHAKRVFSRDCNWRLVHIASLRPQSPPPNQYSTPLTSLDTLKNVIPGGLQPDLDDIWTRKLPQKRLNADATRQGTIHCEAMLTALAHNPSLPSIRNAGIEEVCPRYLY